MSKPGDKRRSKQQQQSYKFFNEKAKEWDDKVRGVITNKVNVIQQRNDYVLHVIRNRESTEVALDVGCGVGDLACAMAKMNIKTTAIDIAEGMVEIAQKKAAKDKLKLVEFINVDYFDLEQESETYDLLAANGFVEYISYRQRDVFFKDAYRVLKKGGSLVVSSRNRLFNLVSANDYTKHEIESGQTAALLREAVGLVEGVSIKKLLGMRTVPPQPQKMSHKNTGITVSSRYQYTPVQIAKVLHKAGFEVVNFSPIHIHAAPPKFKEKHPEIHFKTANLLQENAVEDWSLLPSASAFMVHARKKTR